MSTVTNTPGVVNTARDDTPPPPEGTPAAAASLPWDADERAEWSVLELLDWLRTHRGGW